MKLWVLFSPKHFTRPRTLLECRVRARSRCALSALHCVVTGWTILIQFPEGAMMRFFSPSHRVHTGSGTELLPEKKKGI
jgi:hypothetical protein